MRLQDIISKKELILLGFSQNDAEVFLALLRTGNTSAGTLIKETNLHRNIVYTSLDHLISRKLIGSKKQKGRTYYYISDPSILFREFRQKAGLAEEISNKILAQMNSPEREITLYEGNEEYLNLLIGLLEAMPKGATKYVLGTGGKEFMEQTMLPIWDKYHKVARKQGIKIKMIAYESQKENLKRPLMEAGIYEVKYLPDEVQNPAGIHIYPELNTVLNIIYSDETHPVGVIKIKSDSIVKGYLNLFRNLWE